MSICQNSCDSRLYTEVLFLKWMFHNNISYSVWVPVSLLQLFHFISKMERRNTFKQFSWHTRKIRAQCYTILLCFPLPCRKFYRTHKRNFSIVINKKVVLFDEHTLPFLCSLHCFFHGKSLSTKPQIILKKKIQKSKLEIASYN